MSSKGVLLFSFNNETLRYDLLAIECARRIKQYLDLPVKVVTDIPIKGLDCIKVNTPKPNSRFYPDANANLKFLNGARADAYALSPFQETLVIDTDYLLQTDTLLLGFKRPGLKMSTSAINIDGTGLAEDMRTLGPSGLPMYWATILFFDRSNNSRLFFKTWKKIIEQWEFYVSYFRLPSSLMRNDFAVTLALHKMFWQSGIPPELNLNVTLDTVPINWQIASLGAPIIVTDKEMSVHLPHRDLHVLNKISILKALS